MLKSDHWVCQIKSFRELTISIDINIYKMDCLVEKNKMVDNISIIWGYSIPKN